jgi:hypothetical protein
LFQVGTILDDGARDIPGLVQFDGVAKQRVGRGRLLCESGTGDKE